jgi:hypothetical protein
VWLQRQLGAFVFAVDHPGVPQCAGAHRLGQPCDGTRGKHPCGRWSRDSTNDAEVIRTALSRGLRNLGIDCGKSGLLVVDEDRPGAFRGNTSGVGEEIPATFAVRTSKGRHFYLRQPEGELLGNGRGKLARPGNRHPGHRRVHGRARIYPPGGRLYAPADPSVPVAPAPAWLVAALRTPVSAPSRGVSPGPGFAYGRLRAVVATVLDARVGERNSSLYWASCRLAEMISDGQLDERDVVDILTRAGEATGLGPGEVAATVASGLRLVRA